MRLSPVILGSLVLVTLVFQQVDAIAQSAGRLIDRGIYFGGTQGHTNLEDDRFSVLVKPFVRHSLSTRFDGEFAFGIGILNSTEYRTRIIPADYRINYHPFRSQITGRIRTISASDLFVYAGAGVLNYHNSQILRPDDPLTVHAGKTISNSKFWSFDKNWTMHVPIGFGTRIWLDDANSLLISGGYTFTGSSGLDAFKTSSRDGFWTISVGLSLRNLFGIQIAPPPPVVRTIPSQMARLPEVGTTRVIPMSRLPQMINFATLSAELEDIEYTKLLQTRDYLRLHANQGIVLRGHTDANGTDPVNDILGYQRAWMVKSWLMDAGIDETRILISGLSYMYPIADNTTESGRRENRRVELQPVTLSQLHHQRNEGAWWNYQRAEVNLQRDLPAVGGNFSQEPFTYTVLNVIPRDELLDELDAVARLMNRYTAVTIKVIAYDEAFPNVLLNSLISQARASRVKEYLVSKGVQPHRITVETQAEGGLWLGPSRRVKLEIIRTK